MNLSTKTVLIPGASRAIGRAIARKFAACHAQLVLPVFDWPESIAEMEREFEGSNTKTLTMHCDLRCSDDVQKLSEATASRFGEIDFLVNNIERGGMPIVHGSYDAPHNKDQWDLEFETTLKAKWQLYNIFKELISKETGGAVVNISSIAGQVGRSGSAAPFFNDCYSAANRGVELFTQHWAKELAPFVRVNELQLGFIQNRHGENTRGWQALTSQEKEELITDIPLQRTGTPEEVAEAVFFLAVEARYITGAVLRMDGGFLLGDRHIPPIPPGIL